ncbi:phosphoserine phosphatase SerB [Aurantimonas sp. VKM B-3413]|uniref:phosphoserine phosphatase SerB n=1 Tax=Aurantimonas sp. VKM B-3413 TaxID=2779401 RepID=UPI001E4E0186|nr:phosphoserine phosphatase SerB [Aurantimonas sp. VKM B-3413]MCB8835875.1 phosphoserine phosphatase SerB [Aurantimonas sp. VKM B-3413]
MHVATLIAAQSGEGLPTPAVEEIAAVLGLDPSSSDWLAPGQAADLMVETEPSPDQRRRIAEIASTGAFDCVVQEATGRRKKFLIADMDSTMIGQECIDELAAEIGIKDHIAAITARAMNGEIAFEPALRERVALLKGLAQEIVDKVIAERITLAPGGATLIRTMRAEGGHTALVSGGFTVFTSRIADMLGFHENRANVLLVEDGKLTGRVAEPILGAEAKVTALNEIAERLGLAPREAIAVGDGANDLGMIGQAGTGVALHAKPAVAAKAPHRVDHGDLTALLYIQGYRQADFRA